MQITVVGLGKIGLPLAVQFASKGNFVTGVDINAKTVDLINLGLEPFPGEEGLALSLSDQVTSGRLSATSQATAAIGTADVIVVAVPLFLDELERPNFEAIDTATRVIGQAITPGTLVSYETTLPVGATKKRLSPIIEQQSGLTAGEDFFVVFSPERVLTGRVFSDLRKYPKLVGGINAKSESMGIRFYESVLDFDDRPDLAKTNAVWPMGSCEAAEFAKLAETTYRDVNIGLANQFARYAEEIGVDIYKVIEACNSQPYSHIHSPGIAVGGHCIPVYPHLYMQGDREASVVAAAREANKKVPKRMIKLLQDELGNLSGKRVAILGLAYRSGVKEHAFSGTLDLVTEAKALGAELLVHDPLYSEDELKKLGYTAFRFGESCDAVILQTNHKEYSNLAPRDFKGAHIFIDGRNAAPESIKQSIKTFILGIGF